MAIWDIGDVYIGRDTALTPQLKILDMRFVLIKMAL